MLPWTALLLRVVLKIVTLVNSLWTAGTSVQLPDCMSYKYCATLTAARTTIVIAPMIVIAITVIIFAILKANFPSYLMFLRVLSVMSQQPPVAERYNTLHKMWA